MIITEGINEKENYDMANIVVVSGRMVADPELRNISEDKACLLYTSRCV